MVECWLPYGKTEVHISIPIRNLIGTAEPDKGKPAINPEDVLKESLQNPIDSKKLGDMVEPRDRVAVAIQGTIIPPLATSVVSSIVEILRQTDVSPNDITVLVGNGLRERSNPDLIEALQASERLQGLGIVEHNRNSGNLTTIGTTSRKTEVEISQPFASADVRIVVGEVMLDHFTGLRGAQNTILPALSGQTTIEQNHRLSFSSEVTPAVYEGNPVHADVMEAAFMTKVDLALHLVTNHNGELLTACAGDLEKSWGNAVSELGTSYMVKAEADADIIVVSAGGSRFDFDLYHSIWALSSVSGIAKKGATIILLAECSEGLGADGFMKLSQVDTLSELRRRYMLGARAVHLIKSTLRRNEVIFVSALPSYHIESLGVSVERTANDALRSVVGRRRGRRTLVVTHGCSTIPFVG
jgi:nickel-dependent lactate racemase